MSYVGNVKIGSNDAEPVAASLFGTCKTPADTAAKVVELANFDYLLEGVTIKVRFENGNTVANPTLAVGGTTATTIRRYDSTGAGTTIGKSWHAGEVVSFTYIKVNGTGYWYMNDARDVPSVTTETVLKNVTVTNGTAPTFTLNGSVLEINAGSATSVTIQDSDKVVIGSAERS